MGPERDEKCVEQNLLANSGEKNESLLLDTMEILWFFAREHYCGNS